MRAPPLFEVTAPATVGNATRCTTAANVRALIGSPTGDDTLITSLIDRASLDMANYCGLARDVAGALPTFGKETCQATWFIDSFMGGDRGIPLMRPHPLRLPWRKPIAITTVTENGVDLTEGVDFVLEVGALLYRLMADARIPWSFGKIVVVYEGGYDLSSSIPPDLEKAAIEQVKYAYQTRRRDMALKSETIPDIRQVSYATPMAGGILGDSGLLLTVESDLASYKDWTSA